MVRIWLDIGVGFFRPEHEHRPEGMVFLPGWTRGFVDVTDVPAHTMKAGPPLNLWLEESTGFVDPEPGRWQHFEGRAHVFKNVTDEPASTVMSRASGVFVTTTDESTSIAVDSKPAYRVPAMAEVEASRATNGHKMVSTFSGCGGSCLGFEMAGFEVLWANEFDPHAADSYEANHRHTTLDRRGIRAITAAEVLEAIGMQPGELDVLEGSPPCSKFSTAGKRAKSWGRVTGSDSKIGQANVEDLFFEYVRLVETMQPKVLVAENVAGLNKGVAKGYLIEIIRALRGCGYRVKVGDVDAQWLGVPQRRRRLIFMGVRNDLGLAPRFPTPLTYRYSVAEACPWLIGDGVPPMIEPEASKGLQGSYSAGRALAELTPGETHGRLFSMSRAADDEPAPTVMARGTQGTQGLFVPREMRRLSIAELKRICSFPDDFVLTGAYAEQWARLGNAVPPLMARAVAHEVRQLLDEVKERERPPLGGAVDRFG